MKAPLVGGPLDGQAVSVADAPYMEFCKPEQLTQVSLEPEAGASVVTMQRDVYVKHVVHWRSQSDDLTTSVFYAADGLSPKEALDRVLERYTEVR